MKGEKFYRDFLEDLDDRNVVKLADVMICLFNDLHKRLNKIEKLLNNQPPKEQLWS